MLSHAVREVLCSFPARWPTVPHRIVYMRLVSSAQNCRVSVLKQAKTAVLSVPAERVRREASLPLGVKYVRGSCLSSETGHPKF